tara:strand:- start:21859 stop:22365 length:507 start_codon:yes stop_codon:yes gene_type:complete
MLVLFTCIISCKDTQRENPVEEPAESYDTKPVLKAEDSIEYRRALLPVWEYGHEPGVEMPVKVREVDTEAITAQHLIDIMNFQYEEKVYLKYHKLSGDTLYVTIDESTFLTQQMGTMGADAYLSVATYTLTELDYVNTVHFDFKEGDHAIPGMYSRQYYIDRNKERFQ